MTRWLLLFCLVPVACGAPADPVKGYQKIWRANCDAVAECVEQAPEEDWDWIQTRADECAVAGEVDEAWAESVRTAVDEGRIIYDRDLAKDCLKAYKDIDCTTMWDESMLDACAKYLAGQLQCDETCSIHEE